MFYAHFVLSKRGPLARIWLAAHWDKKLTKAHVFETNLEASVETIISPQVKMALRTSGHLLLGVVRIYNRKAKYLLADCNEAFVKIKMAFRPGVVDLPEESREAQHNQIYLVEEFHDFDTPLPDISDININRNLTLNQSRIEEITMPEEVPTTFQMDEGFGGGMMGFGKEVDQFSTGDLQNMFYKDDNRKVTEASKGLSFGMDSGEMKDRFGGDIAGGGMLDENFMEGPGLFGEGENFFGDDPPNRREEAMDTTEGVIEEQPSPRPQQQERELDVQQTADEERHNLETVDAQHLQTNLDQTTEQQTVVAEEETNNMTTNRDETTLVANEEEAFALEPLDITGVKDVRIRRKRKLIVDQLMELDGQTMREQLKDFSDIVTSLDMAPPTKRLMQWKEMGGVDKLFSNPSRVFSDFINKVYLANLHLDIPADLIDISGNQLQQQYGIAEDENDFDESSIQVPRADASVVSINPNQVSLDQSSILQAQKRTRDVPGGDVSITQPVAQLVYNSDDDDYEPYSVGPPSVSPNISPPRPPELLNDSALRNFGVNESTGLPAPQSEEPELGPPAEPLIDNSAEPGSPEEETEETGETFQDDVEDLRWNKRTQHLMHTLDRLYKHHSMISFFQLTDGAPRKQAVSKFYSLLVLAKQEACKLHQAESYSDVFLQKGLKFESCLM